MKTINLLHKLFTYDRPDYKLSSTDQVRTRILFTTLNKKGGTTKHHKRERQSLQIIMIRRTSSQILEDGIKTLRYFVELTHEKGHKSV